MTKPKRIPLIFASCICLWMPSGAKPALAQGRRSAPGSNSSEPTVFDAAAAQRFAKLALACVHKEYPNKLTHSLNSDADVAPPRKLTPAFYGCYDWHSSVHGHWLLVRLARAFPDAPFTSEAVAALRENLTPTNLEREAAYLNAEGRTNFERPYGLAWLLQLGAELHDWESEEKSPLAHELLTNLRPLEQAAAGRLKTWLPKLSHPVRSGEHSQTAFAMGLLIDYARRTGDEDFLNLLVAKAREFYLADRNCPLAEADVVRRILPAGDFAGWLRRFLPQIPRNGADSWLQPEKSPDPSDPKLAHIDGLNLSRAWMLEGIASGLPKSDARLAALEKCIAAHRSAGLAAVTGEHYEGGHWLASFAVYMVTRRGLAAQRAKDAPSAHVGTA